METGTSHRTSRQITKNPQIAQIHSEQDRSAVFEDRPVKLPMPHAESV